MFNSGIFDVMIGVFFVFTLTSTLCSAIREGLEAWLKTRASYLEYAIRELLHDRAGTGLANDFFTHPLIFSLYQGDYAPPSDVAKPLLSARGRHLPSYIPSKSFATALLDLVARGPATDAIRSNPHSEISLVGLRASVAGMPDTKVRRALLAAIDSAQGDLERTRVNVEAWYDSVMERVAGWYKRTSQWIIFLVAVAGASALNVNTIAIADYLYAHCSRPAG